MQKIRINIAIIALTAFVLMLTIVSSAFTAVTFAAEDINGNRFVHPIPAWKREGPSPWIYATQGTYNLSCAGWNPDSTVPKTPHILWVTQQGSGGVAGGYNPAGGMYKYSSLTPAVAVSPISFGGKIYDLHVTYPNANGVQVHAYDEETGEELWVSPVLTPNTIQIQVLIQVTPPTGNAPRAGTTIVVCCTRNIYFVDADTGAISKTVVMPRAIRYVALGGNDTLGMGIVGYANSANQMFCYGSTATTVRNATFYCYQIQDFMADQAAFGPPKLIWEAPGAGGMGMAKDTVITWGSAEQAVRGINRFTGKVKWAKHFSTWNTASVGYGKFYWLDEGQYLCAFDVETGTLVWRSAVPFDSFTNQHMHFVGNGLVVSHGWDGTTRAFDAETGELKWQYYVGDCPYEPYKSWYGTWPSNMMVIGGIDAVAWITGDHMAHSPPPAGEKLYVAEAQTGVMRWTFPAEGEGNADSHCYLITDGMLFLIDAYTNKGIMFGKGPSGVEVSVPKTQITKGETTWIYGKVTDQSPGQPGTPCVSEKDMGPWMEYLHAGMPAPPYGMGGVAVTLYAQSATTGNTITLGTATTSGDTGMFSFRWTPPNEDLYTITAIFNGDNSYWTSNGYTMLSVSPASASSSTVAGMVFAPLAAVVVGGIVIQKRHSKKMEETEQ